MYNEKDLELKGFDLGEQGGGMQLIIAAKTISPTEFYVATLGNSLPKIQNSPKQDLPSDEIMTDEEIEKEKRRQIAEEEIMVSEGSEPKDARLERRG